MTRTLTTVPESACTVLTLTGGARTVSTTDTKWTAADWITLTTCDPADIDTDNPDLWDDEATGWPPTTD